ncbi:MAG: acyltransferase domain-containing protein [Rhodococcus sp. (in: high G+C Gram-positive bacteria)]|uniref:acyltransferase domain-containing protein n=1 Tax=Rhodococcus sp. TaxID=1831 RepID=UPI002ADA73A6|nr:acyltransferase domain-containing protein [Rhodococcus sp. (in: high G+C Gram-positive bacteria)]
MTSSAVPAGSVPSRRNVFLFPGQGSQHPRMAADLYGVDEVFTSIMNDAFEILDDPALRKVWLQPNPGPLFHDITRAQPLLLSVNYAIARTLISAGVRPDAVLGHSVGEIAAAVVADVFDFADALMMLSGFVRRYQHAPAGGMLAVAGSAEQVREQLDGIADVVVGVVNGPRQVLVCGSRHGLHAVKRRLLRDAVTCADVHALQPFHSPLMNRLPPTAEHFPMRESLRNRLRAPRTPMYSGYLGGPLTDEQATEPDFWFGQPARQVLFGPALRTLLADGPCTLIECGPGQSLTALARRTQAVASGESDCIAVIPARRARDGDNASLAAALKQLRNRATTGTSKGLTDA